MFKRQQCTVCTHRDRKIIDAELAEGVSIRAVASKHGFGKSAIARHAQQHLPVADTGDDGVTGLLDSATRALRRAEATNDHRSILECLRFLSALRKQSRASVSAPSAPSQPQQEVDWPGLAERMKEIYGLKGEGWNRTIAAREADARKTADEKLIDALGELVERVVDTQPKVAAAATLLASSLLGEKLDAETAGEVKHLLAGLGEENGTAELVDETDEADAEEGIDAESAEPIGIGRSEDGNDEPAELDDNAEPGERDDGESE